MSLNPNQRADLLLSLPNEVRDMYLGVSKAVTCVHLLRKEGVLTEEQYRAWTRLMGDLSAQVSSGRR